MTRWIALTLVCAGALPLESHALELSSTPPPGHIMDTTGILRHETAEVLSERLVAQRQNFNNHIYLAVIPSLSASETIQERVRWLTELWVGEKYGAVILLVQSTGELSMRSSPGAARVVPQARLEKILTQCADEAQREKNLEAAIKTATYAVAREMHIARFEAERARTQEKRERISVPLLAALAGVAVLAAILGAYAVWTYLWHHNMFDRKYYMPASEAKLRLGGSLSGGHSASVSFANPPA